MRIGIRERRPAWAGTRVVMAAAVTLGAMIGSQALTAQGPGGHEPMPVPKNLQVLPKTMPVADLLKIMHSYNQELGVHCTFCHEADAKTGHPIFASDAKPEKATARIMMRMTHDMNEKYMAQVHDPDAKPEQTHVHCSTCHQGHPMPPVWTAAVEGTEHAKP